MYTEEKKSRGSFEKGDIPQKKGHFSLPDFDMKRKSIEANSPWAPTLYASQVCTQRPKIHWYLWCNLSLAVSWF